MSPQEKAVLGFVIIAGGWGLIKGLVLGASECMRRRGQPCSTAETVEQPAPSPYEGDDWYSPIGKGKR